MKKRAKKRASPSHTHKTAKRKAKEAVHKASRFVRRAKKMSKKIKQVQSHAGKHPKRVARKVGRFKALLVKYTQMAIRRQRRARKMVKRAKSSEVVPEIELITANIIDIGKADFEVA